MRSRTAWADIVWGPVTLSMATVILAVSSLVDSGDRPWPWIVGSAIFIVLHTSIATVRNLNIVRRLGRHYDRVQSRSVQIVSDLGQLTADQFDLWMVDLYLPRSRPRISRRRPFVYLERELSRQLSVSLVDARPQPPSVDSRSGPHGLCFTSRRPQIWYDEDTLGSSPDNLWSTFNPSNNEQLAKTYGVLGVSPIVDQLGNNCVGVLVVHVEPEPDKALRALGALTSPEGRRRLNNACVELNGLLAR